YGKTQLNTGHLVDSQGQPRGQGTELRTDEHGVIRAGKGLFVSADGQPKAQGEALDMDAALQEIDRLNRQLQQLEIAAEQAQALKADVDSQIQMFEQRLKPLNEALLMSAPEGMALTSGEHLQMAATKNVAINAGGDISAGVMGSMTALAGEKLGLFARTGQLSLKASEGPVEVQAQNAAMRLFAEKKLTVSSAGDISFAGKKRITLIGGGSYLRLEAGKIEYGTTATYIRKVKRTMAAGASNMPLNMPRWGTSHIYSAIYQLQDEQGNLLAGKPYKLTTPSGQTATGYTDEEGKTVPVYTRTEENVELHVVQKKPQPQEILWFIGDGSEQLMETELREQP
ncbi:MAG TPA: type VI secretion system tip protein VgrG, partial [Leclercia adecarboxylata]|nr:type VI secretion system tip protein VgrG [Leclercia adecarboxylata]